jgi:hypothetical protein
MDDDIVDDQIQRLDLGSLLIPAVPGTEVQLQMTEDSGEVSQVTIALGDSAVQLQPYAAPKSAGFWDDVRAQLQTSITQSGGTVEEVEGPFGTELRARVPAERGLQPARFVGIEGPRYFLRAVFLGAGTAPGEIADVLEEALRGVVVVRDDLPRPVGSLLPLRIPGDAQSAAAPEAGRFSGAQFSPFVRGPEITEIR